MAKSNNKVVNFIRRFDLLGSPVEFSLDGAGSYRTVVGAFLTLCAFGALFAASVYSIIQNRDTTTPDLRITEENDGVYPRINLVDSKSALMVFTVIRYDNQVTLPEDLLKYITIGVKIVEYQYNYSSPDPFVFKKQIKTHIFKPWSEVIDRDEFSFFKDNEFNFEYLKTYGVWIPGYLIDENLITVIGTIADETYGYAYIQIYPWTLSDTTQWKPIEDLRKVEISLTAPKLLKNYSNKEEPVKNTVLPRHELLH